jgi:hypothetical protein
MNKQYSIGQFLDHIEQAMVEQIAWHGAKANFADKKQEQAYAAGFKQGATIARQLLSLHADLKLRT